MLYSIIYCFTIILYLLLCDKTMYMTCTVFTELVSNFVPIAIETFGVFGPEAASFFGELGRRIRAETGDPRSLQFLLQGISVAVQRSNAVAVLGTAPATDNVYV